MIHIILGPDHSMVREAVWSRALASDPDGQSTSTLDGDAARIQDVVMAAATIGFFSAGRTIIVENLLARHARGSGKGGDADWSRLFTGVPPATTLILADPSILTVPAPVKKALPEDTEVISCNPPRGRDLVDWIVARARSVGGSIDQNTARRLAVTLFPTSWSQKGRNPAFDRPPDMDALGHEIDKLSTAAHPDPVSEWHIQNLVATGESDQIFAFVDAASSGDIRRAAPELERLLAAGEDPHKILSQLCGSVELAVVMARADRRDPIEVGRELRLANPNRMGAIARSFRDRPRHFAPRVAAVLVEIDRKIKTGELRDPVDALYVALASIAALKSNS